LVRKTKLIIMETTDNRASLFELEEIYKYTGLIDALDRDVIKKVIENQHEEANKFHKEFLRLVAQEVDHKLNKAEFTVLKNKLIKEIDAFLAN